MKSIEFTPNELQFLRTQVAVKLVNAKKFPAANANLIPLLEALNKKLWDIEIGEI